jgi:hypothetical protein
MQIERRPQGVIRRFAVRTDNHRNEDFLFTDDEYVARVARMLADEAVPHSRTRKRRQERVADEYGDFDNEIIFDRY